MEVLDLMLGVQFQQKVRKRSVMDRCRNLCLRVRDVRDEQVDLAARAVKYRMLRGKIAVAGDDAAQGLGSISGNRQGHLIRLQRASPDHQGLGGLAQGKQSLVVLRGGPIGGPVPCGRDFPIGGNRQIAGDPGARHDRECFFHRRMQGRNC